MQIPDSFEFFCPTKILSGKGALDNLPVEMSLLNGNKPLIVVDSKCDPAVLNRVITVFTDIKWDFGVCEGITDDFDITVVKALVDNYTKKGFDSLISVGGAHACNAAKIVNIAVSGDPAHIRDCQGENRIPAPLKPFAVVPTVKMSWHETTGYAFFEKRRYLSSFLMPDLAIIDPAAMKPAPRQDVIETSLAALSNCMDTAMSKNKNPRAGAYAFTAAALVKKHLFPLNRQSYSKEDCLGITNAAVISGGAYFNAGNGMIHRLGNAASHFCSHSEVMCMGVFIPYAVSHHIEKERGNIDNFLLAFEDFDIYAYTPERQRSDTVVPLLFSMSNQLYKTTGGKVKRTVKDLGISEEKLKPMAALACREDPADLEKYLLVARHAFSGSYVKAGAA